VVKVYRIRYTSCFNYVCVVRSILDVNKRVFAPGFCQSYLSTSMITEANQEEHVLCYYCYSFYLI